MKDEEVGYALVDVNAVIAVSEELQNCEIDQSETLFYKYVYVHCFVR